MTPSDCFTIIRDGTFRDVTLAAGMHRPMGVMGAGVADLNNDGHIDFYFGTGDPQLRWIEPNRFFRNNRDGTFADMTRHAGFGRPGNRRHGACFIDLNDEGDLDFLPAFLRNLKGNGNNWLQKELTVVKSTRSGVIASVVVKAGSLTKKL